MKQKNEKYTKIIEYFDTKSKAELGMAEKITTNIKLTRQATTTRRKTVKSLLGAMNGGQGWKFVAENVKTFEDLNKSEIEKKKQTKSRKHDPFNTYGYAILAFFRLHIRLIKFLAILTITMAIPLMLLCQKAGQIKGHTLIEQLNFVNIAKAKSVCKQQFLGLTKNGESLHMSCPNGVFSGNVSSAGILP